MGCKCCKKEPLEKRLEGNKLYEIYQAVVEEPNAPSSDPTFTKAQLALRLDLLRGKLMWTGCKSQDFKYYLWFSHPLFSIFGANPVDCFTRKERGGVLFMQTCINSLISFATLEYKRLEETATDPSQKAMNMYIRLGLQIFGPIFLTIIVGFLRLLATCSCVQGIRCWGNWSCCCFSGPCCVKSVRCFFETIGTFGLFLFGIVSIVTLLIVVTLSIQWGMGDTFFKNFFINLGLSWGLAIVSAFVMFYMRSYKQENKKMIKGKTKFEMTCQDIANQGVEIKYRDACSRCLTCCLPPWRIFAAVMMFDDQKDFKVVKSVHYEVQDDKEPMLKLEPEPVEEAPVEEAPVEEASVEEAPIKTKEESEKISLMMKEEV